MKLAAVSSALLICSLAFAPAASAQATKAGPKAASTKKDAVPAAATVTPPSPELVRARMRPPIKGTAYIELIKGQAKPVGKEIHNAHLVKNVSNAPIVGLRIDEYFYANGKEVAVGSGRLRTAIAPGEIAEITTSAELKPGINNSQLQFSQANGQVKPTAVKKFTADKK
jgi:hypothetical protein